MLLRAAAVFLALLFPLSGTITGNPGSPDLLKKEGPKIKAPWWALRIGYFDDWIYNYRFSDEFKLLGDTHTKTFLKFSTYAGELSLGFLNRVDLYTILGSSEMQLDEEIYSKRAFSWAVGSRIIFFKHKNFYIGGDAKYFESEQKPRFFLIDGQAYNIRTNYKAKYEEWQASLGLAYKLSSFIPYASLNYIFSRINPLPPVILVRLPDMNELVDVELKSLVSKKKWGLALGFSLIDLKKMSLAFEWRVFNQNAVNLSGEIRF